MVSRTIEETVKKITKKQIRLGVLLCASFYVGMSRGMVAPAFTDDTEDTVIDDTVMAKSRGLSGHGENQESRTAQVIAFVIQDADVGRTVPLTQLQKEGMARLLEAQLRNDAPAMLAAINDGATFYMRGIEHEATLLLAIMSCNKEIIGFLLEQERVRREWFDSSKKIMMLCTFALQTGQPDILEMLIARIDDVNISLEGVTLLMIAAEIGDMNIIQSLLSKGALVDTHNKRYQTALYFAASAGKHEAVKALLAYGADSNGNPDHSDSVEIGWFDHHNPLKVAAENKHVKVIKLLVSAGAQTDPVLQDLIRLQKDKPFLKDMIAIIRNAARERQDALDKQWYETAGIVARFRHSTWRTIKHIFGY